MRHPDQAAGAHTESVMQCLTVTQCTTLERKNPVMDLKRDERVTFRALPGDRRQAAAGLCDSSVPCHLKNFPAAADARLDSALPGPLRATTYMVLTSNHLYA